MIYPIVVYGCPVLREEAKEITPDYPNIKQLAEDMFATMYNAEGIGLAAPQIGLSIRMFVIDLEVLAEDDPQFKGFKKVFINPQIVEYGEETETCDEGCLSLPGISESVKRPTKIRIQYLDEDMQPHDEVYEKYKARVIQHEYDHLEGKVFIDRISPIRRQMNRGKLTSMVNGKIRCRYRIKTVK